MDVEIGSEPTGTRSSTTGRMNSVTCMFLFSMITAIVAIVLGGVAISRTNTPALPAVTNNYALPGNNPAPAPSPSAAPFMQQSLQERNTAKGNQQGFYFLTFYQSDATCSKFSQLYDPVTDPFNVGISTNPVRIDKTQSQCQQIAYGISWGVLSASSRYINLRQFSSNNCSGVYEDFVRRPGEATLASTCWPWVMPSRLSVSLYYRVTYVNHNNFALNYALPSWGYESFDYHPSKGLFFIGNVFNNEVTSFNPTGSAQDSRPNLAGGRGYPPVETYTLGMNNFTFGSNPAVASNLREFGLNSLGL
jgi:hypothetical protein